MMEGPDLNNVLMFGIAISNAITAYFWWRTHGAMKQMGTDLASVGKSTSSMKDEMATAASSKAEGFALGQADAKEAAVAKEAAAR